MARQLGYSEEEIAALDRAADSPLFTEAMRVSLRFTERMTRDAHTVDAALFEEMKRHYSDSQILEIACVVGLTNYWNRFTTALRIDLSGSNEPYDPPA